MVTLPLPNPVAHSLSGVTSVSFLGVLSGLSGESSAMSSLGLLLLSRPPLGFLGEGDLSFLFCGGDLGGGGDPVADLPVLLFSASFLVAL